MAAEFQQQNNQALQPVASLAQGLCKVLTGSTAVLSGSTRPIRNLQSCATSLRVLALNSGPASLGKLIQQQQESLPDLGD